MEINGQTYHSYKAARAALLAQGPQTLRTAEGLVYALNQWEQWELAGAHLTYPYYFNEYADGINTLLGEAGRSQKTPPAVGDHATVVYPSDRSPAVVTAVGPAGRWIEIASVQCVNVTTGHEPARFAGPFPIWDHVYSDEELERLKVSHDTGRATRRKSGLYYLAGLQILLGQARYYRDMSD